MRTELISFPGCSGPSQGHTQLRPKWGRLAMPGRWGLPVGGGKACAKAQGWMLKGLPLRLTPSEEKTSRPGGASPRGHIQGEIEDIYKGSGRKYLLSGKRVGVGGNEEGGDLGIWLECLRRKSTLEGLRSPSTRLQSFGSGGLLPTFRHSPFQLPETECPHR